MAINKKHIRADGIILEQFLKGKTKIRQVEGKAWTHEISGRLVSLAGDAGSIDRHAKEFVQKLRNDRAAKQLPVSRDMIYSGYACAHAYRLRGVAAGTFRVDVIYTPLPTDQSHSDIIIYNMTSDEDIKIIRDWLLPRLQGVLPSDVNLLVSSCGRVVATPNGASHGMSVA